MNKNFTEKKFKIGLKISNLASKRIVELIEKNEDTIGIRLNIKKNGCAGFSYVFEKINQIKKNDLLYEYKKAKIYVSSEIIHMVDGTKIDYVKKNLNFSFKFTNPRIQYFCGCGESFTI